MTNAQYAKEWLLEQLKDVGLISLLVIIYPMTRYGL